jgi:hypothetical protein
MIIVLFNSQNSRATLATQKASISATCAQVSSLNFLHFSSSSINWSHVAQIQFSYNQKSKSFDEIDGVYGIFKTPFA